MTWRVNHNNLIFYYKISLLLVCRDRIVGLLESGEQWGVLCSQNAMDTTVSILPPKIPPCLLMHPITSHFVQRSAAKKVLPLDNNIGLWPSQQMHERVLSSSLFGGVNWGPERFSDMSKLTQLVSGRARAWKNIAPWWKKWQMHTHTHTPTHTHTRPWECDVKTHNA